MAQPPASHSGESQRQITAAATEEAVVTDSVGHQCGHCGFFPMVGHKVSLPGYSTKVCPRRPSGASVKRAIWVRMPWRCDGVCSLIVPGLELSGWPEGPPRPAGYTQMSKGEKQTFRTAVRTGETNHFLQLCKEALGQLMGTEWCSTPTPQTHTSSPTDQASLSFCRWPHLQRAFLSHTYSKTLRNTVWWLEHGCLNPPNRL